QLGGRRRTDGPMGKAERAIALGGIALLLGLGAGTGTWLDVALLLVIALIAVTMISRIRGGMRDAGRSSPALCVPARVRTLTRPAKFSAAWSRSANADRQA